MQVRRVLTGLMRAIAEEAERNPDFEKRLAEILEIPEKDKRKGASAHQPESKAANKRPQNRRPAAVLDPIQLARQGETILRTELGRLNLEQLLDVVAEYGMDTGKLVMKWRTPERVIERIVDISVGRAQKGSAFRDDAPG